MSTVDHIIEKFDLEDAMTMDGFDHCIAGVIERFGMEPIICYDKQAVLESLMDYGMSDSEALEFFYFNQIGAWSGDGTPCFLNRI